MTGPQMTDSQELAKAIFMATLYFGEKIEPKDGMPQILHSTRVMMAGKTMEQKITGQLHDTVEDTAITLRDLQLWGFRPRVVDAVDALTRRHGEAYGAYLKRVQDSGPLAMEVKVLDLTDNIERPRPIGEDEETSMNRKAKYIRARAMLEARPLVQNL